MSAQHTPGPWYATAALDSNGGHAVRTRGCIVAVAERHTPPHFDDIEGCANARLIAAAPELLDSAEPEMLEAIADEIDCFEHSARAASLRFIAKRQRAAITKATGSTS